MTKKASDATPRETYDHAATMAPPFLTRNDAEELAATLAATHPDSEPSVQAVGAMRYGVQLHVGPVRQVVTDTSQADAWVALSDEERQTIAQEARMKGLPQR